MKSFILAIVLLLSGSAIAGCAALNEEDRNLFIASNIAIFADWQTTRDMARRPLNEGYKEVGPVAKALIGTHPSAQSVDAYIAARFLANYYLACRVENSEFKHLYLIVTTTSHGLAAVNNYNIGLRIRF